MTIPKAKEMFRRAYRKGDKITMTLEVRYDFDLSSSSNDTLFLNLDRDQYIFVSNLDDLLPFIDRYESAFRVHDRVRVPGMKYGPGTIIAMGPRGDGTEIAFLQMDDGTYRSEETDSLQIWTEPAKPAYQPPSAEQRQEIAAEEEASQLPNDPEEDGTIFASQDTDPDPRDEPSTVEDEQPSLSKSEIF